MARYTFQQLKDLWVQAGGSPVYADIAAAVALAESGGDPNSTNVNQGGSAPGSVDRGLWQINSYFHPSQSTYDPMANARGAVSISQGGTNWRPWCTAWSNGRCGGTFLGPGSPVLKYLPGGNIVSGNVPTDGTNNAVLTGNPLNTELAAFKAVIGKVLGFFGVPTPEEIGASLLKYVYYLFLMAAGSFLMVVGLVLMILGSRPVKRTITNVGGMVGGTATQAAVTKRVYYGRARPTTQAAPPAAPQPASTPVSAPADASPGEPSTGRPVLEPMPSTTPSYKPRHQLMVDPGVEGGAFRQGTGRKRPRARAAVVGRDKPKPTPEVFTIDTLLTPKYQGRHQK